MRHLVERWENRKITCRLKAKQSKKDYLKTARRIKARLGTQLYLLGKWKSKQSLKTFRKFKCRRNIATDRRNI